MNVKLDEVCKRIYAGGDVPKDRFSETQTEEYHIPIFANAESNQGLYGYTDKAREYDHAVTVAARGTIGYTAIRTEPFLPVVRLITVVPDETKISLRYLYYALKNCKPTSSGTSIPQLTVPDIKKYSFNIYDLKNQEMIADTFDKLQSIITHRKQQLEKLDELIKTRFVEMFECNKYPLISVEEMCSEIVDCPHTTPKYEGDLRHPAIRTSEIKKGFITWDSMKYVSDDEYAERTTRLKPEPGDIVYGREGTFGNAAILPNGYEFCLGQRVMLLRPDYNKCTSEYMLYAIISDDVYRQAIVKNNASTVAHVNVKDVKQFRIPIPLKNEQIIFATFVDQTNKSKVAVQKALDEAQLLFDSLMQEYFG